MDPLHDPYVCGMVSAEICIRLFEIFFRIVFFLTQSRMTLFCHTIFDFFWENHQSFANPLTDTQAQLAILDSLALRSSHPAWVREMSSMCVSQWGALARKSSSGVSVRSFLPGWAYSAALAAFLAGDVEVWPFLDLTVLGCRTSEICTSTIPKNSSPPRGGDRTGHFTVGRGGESPLID